MIAPARSAAYHALRAVAAGREDLPTALAHSRTHLADDRDRRLAADIVTGTLRWQLTLDHLIQHFSRRRLDRIDPDILIVLRLSLYQLIHLTRVPASAVVDDAVDLARAVRKTSAAGFVNAVLRAALRQRHRLPLPPRPADPRARDEAVSYLSIAHSHPEWLVGRWLDRSGFDAAEAWVRFNNEPPPLTLRANRLRAHRTDVQLALAAAGVETTPARYAQDGLIVSSGNPLQRPPDGLFFVQDEASQLVPLAVGALPGERVLDVCASPGGKTVAMAADMADSGALVACDVRPRRVALLRDTVRLSGCRNVRVVHISPAGPLPFRPVFDRVLIDAPCSGLGTIRRDPDIRWRRREEDLAVFAEEQLALLRRAAGALKPRGRLVYATCSSEPEENEGVVDRFLAIERGFQLLDLRDHAPEQLRNVLDDRGMLRTLPFRHGLEAFFAAALVGPET
jgi:16S rRNA (cytosine967-C5)-methyltransferase